MTIWKRLAEGAQRFFSSDDAGYVAVDAETAPSTVRAVCAPDPDDVNFTAAVVGLGAKLAKADGVVTNDEVAVFSQVFRAAPEDAPSVRRVFNIARQSVRGYEGYASRIAKKYGDRPCLLEGILDGLFYIAGADGVVTLDEMLYLQKVASIFGFSDDDFRRIKASHLGADPDDPYEILGVAHSADFDTIRGAYRRLMADNHPDRLMSNGAPREFEHAAHEKAAAITSAYAKIRAERGMLIRTD